MIKEKTIYIGMLGIVITFVIYLFIDAYIPPNYKLLIFFLILGISEVIVIKIYFILKKKKEDVKEDEFDYLF
ncbi:MAG: hypothetical protein KGD57_04870 [Candidatus Lokiarchaeota archaeon]|nr:hypothetical protein [Candidatus Lokiarchaeota archaeon]